MTSRVKVLLTFVRGHRQYTKAWLKDVVRYGNVKFHPSTKDHVDPPITPAKVLMVKRVKPFKGNPYWEKDTLKKLGFEEDSNDFVFVKNTPDMCAMLWRVKHLVKIDPVILPKNLPSTVDDLTEFFVHDSGKVDVTGKVDPARYQATMDARTSVKRLNSETVQEQLRLMWLKGNLI
ncbi:39S ribosomal protein L30, mitochondrial [Eufriesea mexicana]|uniref:Large ribosomal subunit protein uL30m n=1 Tax=Eufriesea mexicana TaxID=516756 RepID=A0A310SKV4_9HYME|nr:PREDICTED: 39S ribosomal protein L30, mitochondrial [Eufriesea mexicana]OAD56999.1 39S ribosomal protein L30, mitochondrial [Eufriesea mexicana]